MDVDARRVDLDDGAGVPYDVLVLGAGAVSHDYGTPGVDEHAFPLKHVDDALALRAHVLACFERAAADPSLVAEGILDVVVCGGGPTGVEMAGGLRELYHMVLAKDFPLLPVRDARIVVVELGDRLLAPFTSRSSERARRTLVHGATSRSSSASVSRPSNRAGWTCPTGRRSGRGRSSGRPA